MKAADIGDDVFMDAVVATPPAHDGGWWRSRRDVQATLERLLGGELPEKLFLAKARKLGKKQRLEGCTDCSCRGDYHLPRECREHGCCYMAGFDWRTHPAYEPAWDEPLIRQGDAGAVEMYDAVLPEWPKPAPWAPFRDRIPRASHCYRLASGAMVHVKPDCRC